MRLKKTRPQSPAVEAAGYKDYTIRSTYYGSGPRFSIFRQIRSWFTELPGQRDEHAGGEAGFIYEWRSRSHTPPHRRQYLLSIRIHSRIYSLTCSTAIKRRRGSVLLSDPSGLKEAGTLNVALASLTGLPRTTAHLDLADTNMMQLILSIGVAMSGARHAV